MRIRLDRNPQLSSLVKQWRATVDALSSAGDDEAARLCDRIRQLELQIVAQPARTAEELAAKLLVVSADGEDPSGSASREALMAEVRKLALRV